MVEILTRRFSCFSAVIAVLVICQATAQTVAPIPDGQCIWYDTCDINTDKPDIQYLNCKYDGPAILLEDASALTSLRTICPELVAEIEENNEIATCCSPNSISIMSKQLSMLSSVLGSCPACNSNLRKSFCYLACHPRQSSFLNPTELKMNDTTGKSSVYTVDNYMSNEYIYGTYDSCDSVYYAEMSSPALTVLCGPWGADRCTPERLFDYFGKNDFAPFDITYIYTDVPMPAEDVDDGTEKIMTPFNTYITPCNTNDSLHCLCTDCSESCPPAPENIPPPNYSHVEEMRLYIFIIILLYTMFAVAFIACALTIGLPGNSVERRHFSCTKESTAKIERRMQKVFTNYTRNVINCPVITLLTGIIFLTILSIGIVQLELTTDPVELWASPESRTRLEKDYYDENFGPFYRTNQLIIKAVGLEPINYTIVDANTDAEYDYLFGPVFNTAFMIDILDLQLQIMDLVGTYNESQEVVLTDICIQPLYPQKEGFCLIQSVTNYWQNDPEKMTSMMFNEDGEEIYDYLDFLVKCFGNPTYSQSTEITCLGSYGGPVFPYVVLGGFLEENATLSEAPHYEQATAVVITFLAQNYVDKEKIEPAMAWEKAYLDFMMNYTNDIMDIAYYSERSIQDEIIRESESDVTTILISYLVMFVYVSIALGNYSSKLENLGLESKIVLGLSSVILVFLSVVSSVGLCGFLKIQGTLFVIEVIPFLVLAVGVDNIFILVQSLQREKRYPDESVEEHVSRIVGKVAPSMLLATCSEVVCFFLGALSEMPAVYAFSLYAGFALTIDFILQMTCLLSLIYLDEKRMAANRYDILCCVKGPKKKSEDREHQDVCFSFFEKIYAPFILLDVVRAVIVLIFVLGFCLSWVYIPDIDIGLEQEIGMPDDSYVIKYFDFMAELLSVGPPVYFVVKDGYNYTDIKEQNLICDSYGCNDDSVLTQIFVATLNPSVSLIATGASSWLDSYISWISDDGGGSTYQACCRLDDNGEFINTSASFAAASSTCLVDSDFVNNSNRPYPELFMKYLPDFLIDNPHDTVCPQAGHPAYATAVVINYEQECPNNTDCGTSAPTYTGVRNTADCETNFTYCETYPDSVGANYYMAYHTILKVSKDFTNALERSYYLTDQLTEYIRENSMTPDVEIFPYSIFYVYYEQYLTMAGTAALSIGVSLIAVFVVMIVLTGFDFRSTIINLIIILMITCDIMGLMIPCNVQLNAISLVNLVMAVGISVEFCSHITHAFAVSSCETKVKRAAKALAHTGSSVFSGITLTKFGGIIVLAFANSQVITVFYFRMYMMIVLLGAAHGLIFLPVLLSLIGPSVNPYLSKSSEKESIRKKFKEKEQEYENGGFSGLSSASF